MPARIQIHTYHKTKEADLIQGFLEWQGRPVNVVEHSREALKYDPTGRKGVVMKDGEVLAVGLYQLVNYWNDNGLFYV